MRKLFEVDSVELSDDHRKLDLQVNAPVKHQTLERYNLSSSASFHDTAEDPEAIRCQVRLEAEQER